MDLKDRYFFVLGGVDNEMEEIKGILEENKIAFTQPEKNWGDIKVTKSQVSEDHAGKVLVFVECRPDETFKNKCIVIDHHGLLRKKPASLIQVSKLLKITPSLRQRIIASIDAEFLSRTIKKFPEHKDMVINIWEEGYKKRFGSEEAWEEFRDNCKKLWEKAKIEGVIGTKTAVVWNSPPSMTMLGALADLEGWACLLICGSPTTRDSVPIFFQGNLRVIDNLIEIGFDRMYFGRRYLGCRAIPAEMLDIITELLDQ